MKEIKLKFVDIQRDEQRRIVKKHDLLGTWGLKESDARWRRVHNKLNQAERRKPVSDVQDESSNVAYVTE